LKDGPCLWIDDVARGKDGDSPNKIRQLGIRDAAADGEGGRLCAGGRARGRGASGRARPPRARRRVVALGTCRRVGPQGPPRRCAGRCSSCSQARCSKQSWSCHRARRAIGSLSQSGRSVTLPRWLRLRGASAPGPGHSVSYGASRAAAPGRAHRLARQYRGGRIREHVRTVWLHDAAGGGALRPHGG
jgi:hypothetical protein